MTDHLPIRHGMGAGSLPQPSAKAQKAALKLEATFLAEMLKSAGFASQENSFSGGSGEDQFASFHRQAIATQIAESGGVGLAKHFLTSMMEKYDDR